MFLLVFVRHIGAHPDELQHGVSIQSSINLGKTFPWISRIRIILFLRPKSWRGSLYIYLLSFPWFWSLSIGRFWFWFWSILNGVTLKTGHRCIWTLFVEVFTNMIYWKKAYFSLSTKHVRLLYSHNILFCHLKTAFFSSDILAKSNTCWQNWLILIVCFTASERSKIFPRKSCLR